MEVGDWNKPWSVRMRIAKRGLSEAIKKRRKRSHFRREIQELNEAKEKVFNYWLEHFRAVYKYRACKPPMTESLYRKLTKEWVSVILKKQPTGGAATVDELLSFVELFEFRVFGERE